MEETINSIQAAQSTTEISAVVEGVASILAQESNETFITQKGGKIMQQSVPLQNGKLTDKRKLQSTLLLEKKKEMEAVHGQLEIKRQEFTRRMAECHEKREELVAKQKQIRERVIKFEKFLKENDAKKNRANAKAASERKQTEAKIQELALLKKQLISEQEKSDKIQKLSCIKSSKQVKYQIYENYLQSIIDILPPDYLDTSEPQISDLIMRYNTLRETNSDLISVVQKTRNHIAASQADFAHVIKANNDLILVSNAQLGLRQQYLDKLKQDCADQEQLIERKDHIQKERMRLLGETKYAVDDLYDRCSKKINNRDGEGAQKDKTWAEKLHCIQYKILDLQVQGSKS